MTISVDTYHLVWLAIALFGVAGIILAVRLSKRAKEEDVDHCIIAVFSIAGILISSFGFACHSFNVYTENKIISNNNPQWYEAYVSQLKNNSELSVSIKNVAVDQFVNKNKNVLPKLSLKEAYYLQKLLELDKFSLNDNQLMLVVKDE